MRELSLNGTWEFRFDADSVWRTCVIPGCWDVEIQNADSSQDIAHPAAYAGPVWFRRSIDMPPAWAGQRVRLRFGAVSYHAKLWVNDQAITEHTGMWDAWDVEITHACPPKTPTEILLRVEKPASLTAGPDSAYIPGRFPLRETLSGFLPYVWGHAFGGIWQDVTLFATGPTTITDIWARGTPNGAFAVDVWLDGPDDVTVDVFDANGMRVAEAQIERGLVSRTATPQPQQPAIEQDSPPPIAIPQQTAQHAHCACNLHIPTPRAWHPADPYLYTVVVRAGTSDVHTVRVGLRSVRADRTALLLNEQHCYPRMILSWGWEPEKLCPNPEPDAIRAEFARLKELGYNGVKLCLWVPPPHYFAIADEVGMLLWLELPLWIPRVTPHLRAQLPVEYARIVRQVRQHPAVVLYTLGCELGAGVGADLMPPLYALVKRLAGDALVRDNSGSGEAYGGPLNEASEFYDHHLYAEPHVLSSLIENFAPNWRASQPWLFGEFCDYDTLPSADLLAEHPPAAWRHMPQGARWQYDMPFLAERLHAHGLVSQHPKLVELSHQHALLHRKLTLELVRQRRVVSGYVVTGLADTPITTAGMWTPDGTLKFDVEAFAAFNGEQALLLGWGRRRTWQAGGDRVAYTDQWCHRAGELLRLHVLLANDAPTAVDGTVDWQLTWDMDAEKRTKAPRDAQYTQNPVEAAYQTAPIATGAALLHVASGETRAVALIEVRLPAVDVPHVLHLRAATDHGITNTWRIWAFPAVPWPTLRGVAVYDPGEHLVDLRLPAWNAANARVVIATAWNDALAAWVEAGGRAIVIVPDAGFGPLSTVPLPFWREALRVCEPHRAWGAFPHAGWAAEQFLGMTPDRALVADDVNATPLLWRLDTRTAAMHHYISTYALGKGQLIVTTLRLWGGQGTQPTGMMRNPGAQWLLWEWVRYCL